MTLDEYMKLPYVAVIKEDQYTDGTPCFRAEHPDLPGCVSDGRTREEAIINLEDAKRLYIETMIEIGQEVPLPAVTVSGGTQSNTPSTQSVLLYSEIILVDEHSAIKTFDSEKNMPVESESWGVAIA